MSVLSTYIFVLWIFMWNNPIAYISHINQLQKDALQKYEQKNYKQVITTYTYLIEKYNFSNETTHLNLAHAYFKTNNLAKSAEYYHKVLASKDVFKQSIALMQLALIAETDNSHEDAFNLLKKAILLYPANIDARYNYELLKKRHKDLPKSNFENQSEATNQRKSQNYSLTWNSAISLKEQKTGKERLNKTDEKGTKEGTNMQSNKQLKIKKLQQINLDVEKAHQILETMKNQETQYLQQKKRASANNLLSNKPTW